MANLYSKVRELVTGLNGKNDNELYQVMFDTAVAGMVTIDSRGCIQACNPALCQIFGYRSEELLGQSIELLMPSAYARNHQKQIDDYIKTGQATVVGLGREVMAMRKNGDEFMVHLSVSEMTFAGTRCFTGVVHDLSASIEQNQQRYRDQAWLGNVLDQTPAAVLVKDIDGRYLLLNRRAEDLFLTRAEQAVGHTDRELFDPHWASVEARTDNEVLTSGMPRVFVQPILQQGVSRNLLMSKNLLADGEGQPMGIVSLCIDISSLSALKVKEKNNDSSFLNLLPQALALISTDGDILQANQAYSQRFGMNVTAVQDCNLKVVETETVIQAFHKLLSSDMQEIQVEQKGLPGLTLQQYRLDGEEVVLLSSDIPPSNFSSEARDPLEPGSTSLTDNAQFIASLSHELRTPLNSVIGFSQILKSDTLKPDQLEAVDMIERAGKHLVALVDQVLDLIKLEGAVAELQNEPFSLLPVIEECVELASSLEQQHRIQIQLDNDNGNPWAIGDRIRVKQIILNLITNALKYNRDNRVVVVEVMTMAEGHLRVCVNDEGIGIAEKRQDKIFVPFERLGAEHSAIEGNGLGLAICRQLAERMNGTLDFISVEGQGSSFWLELPTAQPLYSAGQAYRQQSERDFELDASRRVLYIEDNLINARFVELGFKSRENVDVTIAHSGQEGMDIALQQSPDVILLDMRLPDIHGLDLLKKLRDIPELKNARIYGVSADALPDHIDAAEDAGLDGYMTKPLDLNELNDMICH